MDIDITVTELQMRRLSFNDNGINTNHNNNCEGPIKIDPCSENMRNTPLIGKENARNNSNWLQYVWNGLDFAKFINVVFENSQQQSQYLHEKENISTNSNKITNIILCSQYNGISMMDPTQQKPQNYSSNSKKVSVDAIEPLTCSQRDLIASKREEYENETKMVQLSSQVGGAEAASIIHSISSYFHKIAIENTQLLEDGYVIRSKSTRLMSGSSVPKISLSQYISRIVKYLNKIFDNYQSLDGKSTGITILLIAAVYIERMLHTQKDFVLCDVNIHRVFFASIVAAMKFSEDEIPEDSAIAEIGGIDLVQACSIEKRFCGLCNYSFWIDNETVNTMYERFHQIL